MELVSSLLALERGNLFPVLNYEEPDPECPIKPVTSCDADPNPQKKSFLNLNMSTQGLASCVLVSALE